MGDGEIGVSGVEVAGEVTVTVHIIKGKKWPLPMAIQKKNNDACFRAIAR